MGILGALKGFLFQCASTADLYFVETTSTSTCIIGLLRALSMFLCCLYYCVCVFKVFLV